MTQPEKTLSENGVDSLRFSQLLDDVFTSFHVQLDAATAYQVPARDLLHSRSGLRRMPAIPAAAVPPPPPVVPTTNTTGTDVAAPASTSAAASAASATASATAPTSASTSPAASWTQERSVCGVVTAQVFGVVALLGVVAACAVPAAYFHDWVITETIAAGHDLEPWILTFGVGPGLFLLATPIVWMLCLTGAMVVLKWVLIGRYTPGRHALWSWFYLRWWFMDRLVRVWETFVGVHLLDTPYLNMVYKLLGCPSLPLSVRVQQFLREVDLVSVGNHAEVRGWVLCRLLTPRGLVLERTFVSSYTRTPKHAVVYPGQTDMATTAGDEDGDGGDGGVSEPNPVLQRWLAPAFVLCAFALGVYVASWFAEDVLTPLGWELSRTGRVVEAFVGSCIVVIALSIAMKHLMRLDFLTDRLWVASEGMLWFFLELTPMLPLVYVELCGGRAGGGGGRAHGVLVV